MAFFCLVLFCFVLFVLVAKNKAAALAGSWQPAVPPTGGGGEGGEGRTPSPFSGGAPSPFSGGGAPSPFSGPSFLQAGLRPEMRREVGGGRPTSSGSPELGLACRKDHTLALPSRGACGGGRLAGRVVGKSMLRGLLSILAPTPLRLWFPARPTRLSQDLASNPSFLFPSPCLSLLSWWEEGLLRGQVRPPALPPNPNSLHVAPSCQALWVGPWWTSGRPQPWRGSVALSRGSHTWHLCGLG